MLLSAHSTAKPKMDARPDLALVRQRLADNLANPPSLSDLATSVGLSRYSSCGGSNKLYGLAPFQWQRQVRTSEYRS